MKLAKDILELVAVLCGIDLLVQGYLAIKLLPIFTTVNLLTLPFIFNVWFHGHTFSLFGMYSVELTSAAVPLLILAVCMVGLVKEGEK